MLPMHRRMLGNFDCSSGVKAEAEWRVPQALQVHL
jgi:hypothetical protein